MLAIIGKRIFLDFRRPATGHANLVSGVGSEAGQWQSVQRLNRPQIEHRQRVGERRGAGELIVPPP